MYARKSLEKSRLKIPRSYNIWGGYRAELDDYKVFCFWGNPKVIQVDFDRFHNHRRNLYDTQWNYLAYSTLYPTDSGHVIDKPECLDILLDYAARLSENIPFVRIDFYIVNDKPVFGEMTFYHGSGMEPFMPKEWDYKLGEWLELPHRDIFIENDGWQRR